MDSVIKKQPEFTRYKDTIEFRTGYGSIWKKAPKVLPLNGEAAGARADRRTVRRSKRGFAGRGPVAACRERLPKKLASHWFWKKSDASAKKRR
ncbi:hypothetical protein CLOSTMETH_02530 [[Clostridium] methylpentosum DSM 5476]|uniref:Uncharacterized protein n=1 Tax=[Clostridium] methylpentosum DSM 5476 TaxID=537013 RepID=C0EF89_9FIRM|nr:hypothetical protein CLOSTMETH_02530 [[Clostridium] methylpentosum DSM 5476]